VLALAGSQACSACLSMLPLADQAHECLLVHGQLGRTGSLCMQSARANMLAEETVTSEPIRLTTNICLLKCLGG